MFIIDISQKYELYLKDLEHKKIDALIASLNVIIKSIEETSLHISDNNLTKIENFEGSKNAYIKFLMKYQYVMRIFIQKFNKEQDYEELNTIFHDFETKKKDFFTLISTKEQMETQQEKWDLNSFIQYYNKFAHEEG